METEKYHRKSNVFETLKLTGFVLLFLSALLIGCEIIPKNIPKGSIAVAASDTTGMELIGATIFLDGVERGETTPDTLENVPVGQHLVKVKARSFEADEKEVDVLENEIVPLQFALLPAQVGNLEVSSSPEGAWIVVDLEYTGETTAHVFTSIESGLRQISTFLDGYKTLAPELVSVIVDPEDTVSASFLLQPGTLGANVSNIAIDFTLEDDYDNLVSLHNYRGYVVLLTFFFKDCQPCMAEFPIIQDLFEDYTPYGVQVLGIDLMYLDDLEDVQNVRNSLGLSFKLLLDYGAVYTQQCGIIAYPTNIVVAPGGDIVARLGSITYDELATIFDGILGL